MKPGRKPSGMRRVNVILDVKTIAKATAAGAGNLSAGLRAIVQKARVK